MTHAKIFHNPSCSKSRAALALLTDAGLDPEIVLYKKTGWDRDALALILETAEIAPMEALRSSEKLRFDGMDDNTILDAMVDDPMIVERPLVVTNLGARMGRPTANILDIMPNWPDAPYALANGEVLIDGIGNKVGS